MKKLVSLVLILFCAQASFAQLNSIIISPGHPKSSALPNPYVIDTSSIKKINGNFYAGTAWLDHMPVLLPGKTTRQMPNSGKNMTAPEKMPIAWQGSRPDSITPKYKRNLLLVPERHRQRPVNKTLRLPAGQ